MPRFSSALAAIAMAAAVGAPAATFTVTNTNDSGAGSLRRGCGGGIYCPGGNNTRGQMAVFITKAFHLQ